MDVLVFHGYLLRGTGSNVYNAEVAAALARAGHRVHLFSQDPRPLELPWVDAAGTWEDGRLELEVRTAPAQVTVYRPPIGPVLPVYVLDRYEGFDVKAFPDLTDDELATYLDGNVAAVREVAERVGPDVALANHLVMGPAILARALAGTGVPYAVKVHGSALEYTVKPDAERFLPYAREGLDSANGVLVGSRHTAESLWAAVDDPDLPARTRLGPPGVDVDAFVPRPAEEAARRLHDLVDRLAAGAGADNPDDAFARDPGSAAAAMRDLDPRRDRIVTFVGKLIVSKGVDLLLAAWPRVLARVPDAQLLVVGFGAYREGLERMAAALTAGDTDTLEELAGEGRAAEGGPRSELAYLQAFLDRVAGDDAYREAAARMGGTVHFAGRLEHDELADVLPACEAMVVPSTFPEAFGMVAAEAAACGALPVSADHSGLAEVSHALAADLPDEARHLVSFGLGDAAVDELADRLIGWLDAPADLREAARTSLVRTARDRYSWTGVARTVIAAAEGRLEELPAP
jgi:glycosyltransferase involved in cell wall biosynthesis